METLLDTGDPLAECDANTFKRLPSGNLDPVHQHKDGSWWFANEVWADCLGPYPSREVAEERCLAYARQL